MIKLSDLTGKDVFNDNANFIGKVYDVVLDLQKGEVVRLTLEPIRAMSKDEAKRVFSKSTIMYKSVKAVEKIIIVSSKPLPEEDVEEEMPKEEKAMPFSYRYRKP